MPTYHIHITGLVQGVGFRPAVHKLAVEMGIVGWVKNGTDGVHIQCHDTEDKINQFYRQIIQHPPSNSIIINHTIESIHSMVFKGFEILTSSKSNISQMMLTPDIALCDTCKKEINDPANRRYGYAFTTCLQCGPRYSITEHLPYDRENTTMHHLKQCPRCLNEYDDICDVRHHSQTNSCKNCAIKMHLYSKDLTEINTFQNDIFYQLSALLTKGHIIAIKAVGGFLLVCDATNKNVIQELRKRKKRPTKPFALLYADIDMLQADLSISPIELNALKDKSAPIVLCKSKQYPENNICLNEIAPGLLKIGGMLPASPLLQLLVDHFGKPLVATSANISGSPIIYQDDKAKEILTTIADYILCYDRDIIAPQDDSVIQFGNRGQKIILRRSRGLAPNYYPSNFHVTKEPVLAMGAELKGSFAIASGELVFVSQFLGNQQSLESNQAFESTLKQVSELLDFSPSLVLVDDHPNYQVSKNGIDYATENGCKHLGIQHHEAHFAAVLAENKLLELNAPVMGIIWDGAGYGKDGQIWGGEIFLYDEGKMNRCAHLAYFPQLLGNKMNKEPRLSALSILKDFPVAQKLIKKHFTDTEWLYYQQVLSKDAEIQTSSMGRLIDAVACILGIKPVMQYEGEAAMLLEALANKSPYPSYDSYHLPFHNGIIDWRPLIQEIIHDWLQKEPNELIAWKFFYSLAKAISAISSHYFIDKLAFSGGVFQNVLLTDMVIEILQHKRHLYFHQQLSPNDECIGFGQLAWYSRFSKKEFNDKKMSTHFNSSSIKEPHFLNQ